MAIIKAMYSLLQCVTEIFFMKFDAHYAILSGEIFWPLFTCLEKF